MNSLNHWMAALRQRHNDYKWVSKHISRFYDLILTDVNRPPDQRQAFEALQLLYPYILIYENWEHWIKLWYDALISAINLKDVPVQTELWRGLGGLYAVAGNHKRGRAAFENFLQRATEVQDPALILLGYAELINLQTINQDQSFNKEAIDNILKLAQKIDHPRLWAETHKALALAYNIRHETIHSLAHGQTAYCYWRAINETIEMARTAFTLAQTYRLAKRFDQAKRFLELSRGLYAKNPSNTRFAALDYEEGMLCYDLEAYEEAEQWFKYAYNEFRRQNQPYQQAAALHTLATTYIYLGLYEKADIYFNEALKIWGELDNVFEQAHLYYAKATMEKMLGNTQNCIKYARIGLALCKNLPTSPALSKMVNGMNDFLQEIEKPPV
jgi:tetratricopeptide (TPR) repeat protein